jgi:hypothetical protein
MNHFVTVMLEIIIDNSMKMLDNTPSVETSNTGQILEIPHHALQGGSPA